ncbi:MAG: hypothetical protein MZV63_09675 [Marinilabiliales bacterium]|nr:hypothetical protein [Marinilabiliales bacterium]
MNYYLDEAKVEPFWAGSQVNLVDTFYYGQNYVKVDRSIRHGKLLYSRGYSTLFGEWQTTEEAKQIQAGL